MLACAHPEDLAGLVLLDPTPVNDPAVARRTETVAGAVARVSRWPVLGRALGSLVRRAAPRSMRGIDLQPAAREALLRTAATDLGRLGRAAEGLGDVAAAIDPSRLPRVPAVVVTADRRESAPRWSRGRAPSTPST